MARPITRDTEGPGPDAEPERPTSISGPIGERWRALGGAAWGLPDLEPMRMGDGRGLLGQFSGRDGSLRSIVWTAQTGAWVVAGAMNSKWRQLKGERGPLGYPASDEMPTHDGVGRWQTFEGGQLVWHPETGVHEVYGAILARYKQLGGTSYGYPTTGETATPDGRGRFNHFRELSSRADKSIYWTPETGAHEVLGYIRSRWAELKWERGLLGYPASGEKPTHDGVGRWQTFEGGQLVWHPETGAHEVHGAILARYKQLGGTSYGYPTTGETATPDGRGRFNHFRELPSRADKSIYWTSQTGAHEIYGQIRSRWAELKWESGHLGYPTTGELPWAGAAGGRVQSFTGGRIFYTPKSGAYADPMKWLHLIRAGGFKGQAEVTAHADGRVQLRGYVRSSAAVGFEYLVQSMLRAGNHMAVAFTHQGKVSSTHGSDEKDELSGEVNSPVVRDHFPDFQRGELIVTHNHRNRFTGAIGDLLESLIKWTAGELVITPGTGLILVTAASVVSLATSGSLIPGARVIDGTLWLAGPSGTLFALAADGLTRLATKEETLSQADYDFANQVFRGSLPPRERIVVANSLGANGRPFTYPRFDGKIVLNLGDHYTNPRGYTTSKRPVPGQLLIHELVHAWQYHNNAAAISYVGDALWARVREDYDPGKVLSEPWDSFGLEEQATIVDKWFGQHHQNLDGPAALKDQAFRFIRDNIRTGRN